ncbi:PD-(D/E)XK nuclease family protein [bacterium]|nr:PD-(D/E)XK nuclease family protein [bacterium]
MITKDLNFNQLVNYIIDNPKSDLLIITQDKIFRDALNRKLNEKCLNETNWVRKSANIMTLTQWYNMLWDKCRLRCILHEKEPLKIIDGTSEIVLWRNLVAEWIKNNNRPLINANGAADNMRRCWTLLARHNFIRCRHTASLPAYDANSVNGDKTGQCKTFINCLLNGKTDDNCELQPDHRAFLKIADDYRSYMDENNALSTSLIPNALAKIMEEEDLNPALPEEIILANFTQPTPQLREFFKFLENKYSCRTTLYKYPDKVNCKCNIALLAKGNENQLKSPFESLEEELVYAAREAQKVLNENSQNRAAVIIPQLRGSVSDITLILDKALAPHALIGGQENTPRPYILISGEAILKNPVIQDALNLLRLSMSTLSRQKLINIISSGFLKSYVKIDGKRSCDALTDKAELCKKLRRDFHSIYTLEDFEQVVNEYNYPGAKNNEIPDPAKKPPKRLPLHGLHHIIENINHFKESCLGANNNDPQTDSANQTLPLSRWAEYADKLIKASFSLYNISRISKTADNAVGSLIKVLYKLSRASERHYQARVDFKTFMQYLRLLLIDRENNFYYRQDTDGLRILNVKQALGSQFTHLYLIQFNDSNFPAPISSQGYIPAKILDLLGYEKANAGQALEAARRSIRGLTQATDNLFLSFSNTQEKSGSLLSSAVSPLWKSEVCKGSKAHTQDIAAAPDKETWDPGFICCKSIEEIWEETDEEKVPEALPNKEITDDKTGEKKRVFKGGTALINAMCNCPFKAFLTYRLSCTDDDPTDEGLSYTDRGSIIHNVMENTWKELNNRQLQLLVPYSSKEYLKRLVDNDIHLIIDKAIERNLKEVKEKIKKSLYPLFEKWDDTSAEEHLTGSDFGEIIRQVKENSQKALENRWKNLPDHIPSFRDYLRQLADNDIHSTVDKAIEDNLDKINKQLKDNLYPWFEKWDGSSAEEEPACSGCGNILRKVKEESRKQLEERWKSIPDPRPSFKDYLRQLIVDDIHIIIDDAIENSLKDIHANSQIFDRPDAENVLKENEKKRLQAILYPWFEQCEIDRPNDFYVDKDKLEKAFICTIDLGNKHFAFDGRADRIDLIGQNGEGSAVIDYKSGKHAADIKCWSIKMDRAKQKEQKENKAAFIYPLQDGKNYQLPVYAAFGIGDAEKCRELSFGKLTLEDSGFKTLNADTIAQQEDKKKKQDGNTLFAETWDNQIKDWKEMIIQRLKEFMAEETYNISYKANPTNQNCQYCHLKAVCPYKEADQEEENKENS